MSSRITTGWKLAGTTTFRLASAKLLGYYGTNLQNSSHSLMRAIVPDRGHIFIQRDQEGAEAKIVAYEAPYGRFRQLFEANIKPHTYMALQLFIEKFRAHHPKERYAGVSPLELAKYPEWRELNKTIKNSEKDYALGKLVIHAKNYDMGPRTFQLNCAERSQGTLVFDFAQSKNFLSAHEKLFPEIIIWQAEIRAKIAHDRTLHNLFGFPRYFGGHISDKLHRESYSFIPQSTVGCITIIASIKFCDYIKTHKLPWKFLNNKHDSILASAPETDKEECSRVLKDCMEMNLVSSRKEEYKMTTAVSYGYNWDKHSENNPNGMKEQ